MATIRPARWPDDEAGIAAIDTSFATDQIYRVRRGALSFHLVPERVDPPLRKSYGSLLPLVDHFRHMGHVVVAEEGGVLVGVAAADLSAWNRRVQIEQIHVDPRARGRGIGRALLASVAEYARAVGARCVVAETQNVNYPAVQFYRSFGFQFCGIDDRLYDPVADGTDETALFLALDLPP
jgi:ribosomal protein S18 acetylase RimI-like enzyme